MRTSRAGAAPVVLGTVVAAVVVRRLRTGAHSGRQKRHGSRRVGSLPGVAEGTSAGGWSTVTVNRPPQDVHPQALEDRLGGTAEVRLTAAPGGRGTLVAARRAGGRDGDGRRRGGATLRRASKLADTLRGLDGRTGRPSVQEALHAFRQQCETGEVLRTDRQPTGRRGPGVTALRRLVAAAARAGRGGDEGAAS